MYEVDFRELDYESDKQESVLGLSCRDRRETPGSLRERLYKEKLGPEGTLLFSLFCLPKDKHGGL